MKVIHPRAVHQTTVLRLRAAFAAERRNVLPPNDQIWDEAYRLHFRVKVAMMGHHEKFPTLGVQ